MGIQIWTPSWKLEWLYMTRLDDRAKGIREFRVTVMDEVTTVLKESHSSMVTFLAICGIHLSFG